MLHDVPSDDLQDRLFGENVRVLRRGAPLVASDSLASAELEAHHAGDTYNPIEPASLEERLARAGFERVVSAPTRTAGPCPPPRPDSPTSRPAIPVK